MRKSVVDNITEEMSGETEIRKDLFYELQCVTVLSPECLFMVKVSKRGRGG